MSETLPSSWALPELQDVAQLWPKLDAAEVAGQELVHFVPMAAVAENFAGVDVSQLRSISEVRKGYTYFAEGDVLFAKITPCMENGKGGLVPRLERGTAFGSTEFHVFRPTEAIAGKWLAHFLSQPSFRKVARRNMTGTAGQLRVPTKWLQSVRLPVPPRAEQTRIVAKLEELLSDLDAGVAELKAAQKKLQQYRQSLLKAAVQGALTADWREAQRQQGTPTETGAQLLARILTERRARWEAKQLAKFKEQGKAPPKDWQKRYPEPVQPDTTDLPVLPEGWVWASVEQLGDVQLGRQRSPDKLRGIAPTRYIRAANITETGIDFSDVLEMDFSNQERDTFKLHAGDVLLTEASGSAEHVGRPAVWPIVDGLYCFQNTVLRFQPKGVGSDFAFYSFLAMQKLGVFRKLSGGVGINHLSAGKFSRLAFPLSSYAEQVEIVRVVESKLASAEEQRQETEHLIQYCAAQRQNILRAAFSGKLVVQDPHEEPASALLDRQRTERVTTKRGKLRAL